MSNSPLIGISVCLSDIPKDKIKQATNGKKYVNLVVSKRKEKSQYDETHTVFVSQTKEEREAKQETVFVGGGKELGQSVVPVKAEDIEQMPSVSDIDDLPW